MEEFEFTPWHSWLRLALCDDEERVNIYFPWVKGGWMYCTDGKRLHGIRTYVKDCRLDRNFGKLSVGNDVIKPPNESELFKFGSGAKWIEIDVNTFSTSNPFRDWFVDGVLMEFDRRLFNSRYVMDAFAGSKEMLALLGCKDTEPLWLKSIDGDREVLIMPVKDHDIE